MGGKHSGDFARHPRATAADFTAFAVTVDVVLMTILRGELRIFLVQRGMRPHQGEWALPGGLVMKSEPLEKAALRTVYEQTGITREPGHMEQLGAYGDPKRDPRTRVVTVAYWAVAPLISPSYFDLRLAEDSNAIYVEFVPVPEVESGRLRLAFDHARHRGRRPRPASLEPGDDHPRAAVLPPRVHDQPAPGSVRGRLGHPARCRQLPAQDSAERGIRRPAREVAAADRQGGPARPALGGGRRFPQTGAAVSCGVAGAGG